jgi:hypothetical protein
METVIVLHYDSSLAYIFSSYNVEEVSNVMWSWVNKVDSRGHPVYKVFLAERVCFEDDSNPYRFRKEPSCPLY